MTTTKHPPCWCDGTPHSPSAIPPLPLHDWRWDGDNPVLVCARCGEYRDALTGQTIIAGVRRDQQEPAP